MRAWFQFRRPTVRAVARLAGPAIAQQLFHTLVFLVDRAMLGHFASDSLASMQISGPVVWSTFSVLGAFTVGSIALVGRRVGAKEGAAAAAALRASLALAFGLGVLAWLGGSALLPAILSLFESAGSSVHAESRAYLGVSLANMPLLLCAYTAAVCTQAAGNTRIPFVVALGANGINIVLNWVLIFGHFGFEPLGAQGAAWGSAVAIAFEAVVLFAILSTGRSPLSWRGRGGELDALRRMFRVSAAAFVERVMQHVGYMVFVAMIGALGAVAMAANQALLSVEAVVFLSADGFGIAAAAMVAQRLGAGRVSSAALAMRAGVAMAVASLSVVGVVFVLAPEQLLSIMTSDHDIVHAAVPSLYIAAIAAPFMGAAVVFADALRGAGDTRSVLAVTFAGGLLVRLTATWLLAFGVGFGLLGVWLGSTLDWIVRALALSWLYGRGRWRKLEV